jgi:L,D-peptidoglycan transpeptidase YkuD (ErfK/YbiS/YcfS/YnhG family)
VTPGQSPADLLLTPAGLTFRGRRFPASLGRGGLATAKREGDGCTPVGVHRIAGLLFRADRIAAASLPPWAEPIGPRDLWCDAPDDRAYNRWVRAPFAASHECLRRADPVYDLILVVDWNWPHAVPGRGSAIFIHAWRRPGAPTAGCIALAPAHLRWIAVRATPGTRLIVPPLAGRTA